jgi:hypothetical protein
MQRSNKMDTSHNKSKLIWAWKYISYHACKQSFVFNKLSFCWTKHGNPTHLDVFKYLVVFYVHQLWKLDKLVMTFFIMGGKKNCKKNSIFDVTNKWARVWITRFIKSCAIQCMPSMCGENISLILVVTGICLSPLLCPNNGYLNTCGSHYLEFWNPQHQNI